MPRALFAPNIVQDYALVVTAGDGTAPGSFTVADNGIVSNPTGDQDITYVGTTNTPLMNQMVGASSPLLGTNTLGLGTNTPWSSNGRRHGGHDQPVAFLRGDQQRRR